MYAYIHDQCGKPAFLLTEMPRPLDIASSAISLGLNYQPIERASVATCQSCDANMCTGWLSIANLRKMI